MKIKFLAASAALAIAAGGGAVAAATTASAATTATLPVTLSSSPDASNSWIGNSPVLTVGPNSSSTYSEMKVDGPSANGATAPTDEPTFTTDHYAAGSPRWVIELGNGHSLEGYPGLNLSGQSAPDANGMAWAVNNGNTYTDYATAYKAAGADQQNVVVTSAFIVADGDQAAGTSDTLTKVQYADQTIPQPARTNVAFLGYGSKCLDDYHSSQANGNPVDLYWCNGTAAQQWTQEPDGTIRSAAAPTACLEDPGYGWKGTGQDIWQCVGSSNETWSYTGSAHLVNGYNALCLNDPGYSTTAGTRQILWTCGNYANEVYSG